MIAFKMKNNILAAYKKSTAFYKDKLKGCNDFETAPFTDKSELLNSQVKFPPYGNFTAQEKEICQVYRTSGTSSNPLLLTFSRKDVDLITEIGKEVLLYSGMGKFGNSEIVINCLNLSLWSGGFLDSQSISKTGVQVVNFGAGNTYELIKLIKILNQSEKFRISLHCTPSYLPVIEKRLNEDFNTTPDKLNIYSFYLGGESGAQNNEYRNNLKNKWKAGIYNANYGMSEVCSAMASANEINQLKFAPLFLKKYFLEIRQKDCTIKMISSISDGDEGELIITSLEKESQPLFRYNSKEIIQVIKIQNDEIYFELKGRSDDMIVYKGINIFPEQFRTIIDKYPELTGLYKVQAKKENEMITALFLVCELKKECKSDELYLKNLIGAKIKKELSVLPSISFESNFELKGNKLKIFEWI
jgi:phenylacetate-CoA ligase